MYQMTSLGFEAPSIAWKGSPDAGVKELQADINVILKRLGYYLIGVDGVVGGGTCGALALLGDLGEKVTDGEWATLDPNVVDAVVAVCQGHPATKPTKSGAPAQPPPAQKTPTTTTKLPSSSSEGLGTVGWIAVGAALVGGFYLLSRKKK